MKRHDCIDILEGSEATVPNAQQAFAIDTYDATAKKY